ncbi:TadE/TadG family type IV pilus assembly protein [Seohaeicola zhoushanensis]|uniref:TadE-like domain-containing protein n=1 Tax=Seohaeicola zhoushanensis TaxID=1569283 RepID=A0A8J3H0B8_9RHOB|nr:TadE/TadG family type IV pilus assembly protein [Seohaeicola zhoushanensis]GHF58969.1 hypothetical protein GCM10017056_33030 [Seohaeicola zhoushanensis]
MKRLALHIKRLRDEAARLRRDESGTTLVELTLVLALFLLIFFGLIDFGRMAFHYVTTERAMHVAARIAAVRPAACPGLPANYTRGAVDPNALPPAYGTSCSAGANVCTAPATVTCTGDANNATATEIWNLVRVTLPNDSAISNLRFRYDYDQNLGFLGGPYVPVVTVELDEIWFQFVSPLGALAALASGTPAPAGLGNSVRFPNMSVSMPGEDLALGNNG